VTERPHLYVLGGTGFARHLAADLESAGYAVRLSVATSLGADEVEKHAAEAGRVSGGLQVGRLSAADLVGELRSWRARALIDATHPYAVEVGRVAAAAAGDAGIPLLRAARPDWSPTDATADPGHDSGVASRVRFFPSPDELAAALLAQGAHPFFTVGVKGLGDFAGRGLDLAARVLPTVESVSGALAAGVPAQRLVAAYPPYDAGFTAACLRQLRCDVVVSKESGHEGGLDEKLAAAQTTGGELFILARPAAERSEADIHHDVTTLLDALEDLWTPS
jgi:precorrin-6A/cobalt-precorrin-6A reductase